MLQYAEGKLQIKPESNRQNEKKRQRKIRFFPTSSFFIIDHPGKRVRKIRIESAARKDVA